MRIYVYVIAKLLISIIIETKFFLSELDKIKQYLQYNFQTS